MVKSNAERIRRANDDVMTRGRLNLLDQFFTTDYVVHAGGKDHKGHAFIKRWIRQLRSALPDLRLVSVDILLSRGDTIAWRRTMTGTHKTALKRIPPSGRKVRWEDMMVTRFEGKKIAEEWSVSDLAGQLMLKMPGR